MGLETLGYFLIWALFIFVMMRFGCGAHIMGHRHHHEKSRPKDDTGQA